MCGCQLAAVLENRTMKKLMMILAMAACVPAMAADVAVSVTIGHPDFFGRIDIDSYPRPRLIFPQPIVVLAVPAGVVVAPRYLRVPPGHEKHWDKHCAKYDACGVPVYFVDDGWYNSVYVPAYKAKHGHSDKHGKGHGKDKKKDRN
jgi:hypothetical protein